MPDNQNTHSYRWTQADTNVCLILPLIIAAYVVAVNLWGFGA